MVVIIYHSGASPSLRYCIQSVRTHSPGSQVIVVGDSVPDCDFVSEQPFQETYNRFLPNYAHRSSNPPEFELRCLRRWMVIAEYIRTTDIQEYVCIDSDVLCFCDFGEALKCGEEFSFYSPHASFVWVRERKGMEELVQAILSFYENKDSHERIAMEAEFSSGRKPSISDMDIIRLFMSSQPSRFLDLYSPCGKPAVFDQNICETNGFVPDGDRKRLFFVGGYPYAVTTDRHIVRMNTLHCWGSYKARMDAAWQMSRYSIGKPEPITWR